MSGWIWKRGIGALLIAVGGFGVGVFGVPVASAVVVRRETTVEARPTVREPTQVTVGTRTGVAVAPVGARTVTTLPAGCVSTTVNGVGYRRCGSALYRPYMRGGSVVYVVERP